MSFKNFHIENKGGKANIKIVGYIGDWKNSAEQFNRMVDELISSGIEDADLYINSYGGSVWDCNEILNQLERFKGTLKLTIGAIAASAGFTLALSSTKENTYCHENTQGMYHEISGMVRINKMDDFDSEKKMYQNHRDNVVKRLAERMGIKEEEVSSNMKKTTWLNSADLVKYGIVAKGNIIDAKDKTPSGTRNQLKNLGVEMPGVFNEADEAELEDLMNRESTEEPDTDQDTIKNTNNEKEMKELAKKLGLPENATADQINTAIDALQNKAKFADEALTNMAIDKGFKKETVENSIKNNFEATKELVEGIETPENNTGEGDDDDKNKGKKPEEARPSNVIAELMKTFQNNAGASNSKKKIEDYTPEELDKLENEKPEEFEKLFNASALGKVKNPTD